MPLKLGRKRRHASQAQCNAALALYGGCAWPKCPAPWRVVQLHHVIDFNGSHRGRSDDLNLVSLCPTHHHAVTYGHWSLEVNPDRSVDVWRRRRRHRSVPRARHRARAGPDPPDLPRPVRHTRTAPALPHLLLEPDPDAEPLPF